MVQGIESCSKRTPYPVSCTRFRVGDSGLRDQVGEPARPAHPTGSGGAFCVRLGMYVSPRVNILGGGRGAAAHPIPVQEPGCGAMGSECKIGGDNDDLRWAIIPF